MAGTYLSSLVDACPEYDTCTIPFSFLCGSLQPLAAVSYEVTMAESLQVTVINKVERNI